MIEMISPSSTVKVLPTLDPEFRVEPQAPSSFVMPSGIEVFRVDNEAEVQWSAPDTGSETDAGREYLDQIVISSRREAAKHPSSARAHVNLGQALMNAGLLVEAAEEFKKAQAIDRSDISALAHLARVRLLEGESAEALELGQRIVALQPLNVMGPLLVASAAMIQGQAELAINALRSACEITPESWVPKYLLGIAFIGLRRGRDAISHLRGATRNEPRSAAIYHALGVAYSLDAAWKRAEGAFRKVLALDPKRRESVLALAQVHLHRLNREEAISVLSDWVAVVPHDREVLELLAHSYRLLGNYRAAKKHLQMALHSMALAGHSQIDQGRVLNNLGVCVGWLGDHEEAAELYSRAIQCVPLPLFFMNLAKAYREVGKLELAKATLDALPVDQRDKHSKLLSSVIAGELGLIDESVQTLKDMLAEGDVSADAFASLGCVLSEEKRNFSDAIAVLQEGHSRFPSDSAIANNLAYVRLLIGDTESAREILASVDSNETAESVFLTATMGLLRLSEGDYVAAEELYGQAERLAKEQGRPRLAKTVRQKMHLEFARAFSRKGMVTEAREQTKRGLAIGIKKSYTDDLREIRTRLLNP